jgi:hypothetical protein
MADTSDSLSKARNVLQSALMKVAGDLADMGQDPSTHAVEELARQLATIQTAIEAVDRALSTAERYQPSYYLQA